MKYNICSVNDLDLFRFQRNVYEFRTQIVDVINRSPFEQSSIEPEITMHIYTMDE